MSFDVVKLLPGPDSVTIPASANVSWAAVMLTLRGN
jgi:hypothetical protein